MSPKPVKTFLIRRRKLLVLSSAFVLTTCALAAVHVPKVLLWNASASVPEGLYILSAGQHLKRGDLVVISLPASAKELANARHYLPANVPLIKPVTALPGQTVCRLGVTISVDKRVVGAALIRDSLGRNLPVWQGCQRLLANQVFLMNPAVKDSFDGRYFGPVPSTSILARATPLYLLSPKVPPSERAAD